MDNISRIMVSDRDLYSVFGNNDTQNRTILDDTLLRCALGFKADNKYTEIARKLLCIKQHTWHLSAKGKEYLYQSFTYGN